MTSALPGVKIKVIGQGQELGLRLSIDWRS